MRHGAFTRARAAPALWPSLPSNARHAASTRSPSLRAMTLPPCHEPGRPRSALRCSIMCLSLTSHPLRVSGAASTRRSIFCLSRGALPAPAQPRALLPSHRPPPTPPAAARSSPRLRSPRRPSLPRAPRSRRFVCLRAQGLFAQDEELRTTRRTLSAAPRTASPPRAGSPCTTHSLYPSPITHISLPVNFHLHNPIPPSLLAPLVIPPP